jgi:transposase
MYFKFWQYETDNVFKKEFSSQRISDLLLSITEDERINFYLNWAENVRTIEYLALDCTSISSYSQLIGDVNWGYNRDGEKLPQVNLCLLTGEISRIPVFPMLYDGSIKDVSTLTSMLAMSSRLPLNKLSIVTDKGFSSNQKY